MGLKEYKRKRDFKRTPEPAGGEKVTPGRQFVVQKHAARRLHYDFRLELNKTLKSWAVPKGPSLDPAVKSLAVHVEDHPLEYASFEGVIPQGEYGGGTVMVWDRGTWEPEGDAAKGYERGKLKFRLNGKKLHGGWSLVRMGGRASDDGKNWLLIKQNDDDAKAGDDLKLLVKKSRSVLTDREMEDIASDADRVWSSNGEAAKTPRAVTKKKPAAKRAIKKQTTTNARARPATISIKEVAKLKGARRAKQPDEFKPQLAQLASEVPKGNAWLHELKFDGYRMLAFFKNGNVRLITRNGNDWSARFPKIISALKLLPLKNGLLDGEIVSLDKQGLSSFQQLQNMLKRGDDDDVVIYLFDVPHCQGYDITQSALTERKELLARVVRAAYAGNDGSIRYSDHIEGEGPSVLAHACRYAMEGVISKRADSTYQQRRSPTWRKVKCIKRQEFIIAGYTKPTGSRVGFGALLLGYYTDSKLTYAGRVGTGFTNDSLRQLKAELSKRRIDNSPFEKRLTSGQRRGVTWVQPELVCEVEFTEWTGDGILRHPSFQGLREDKQPKQVVREEPGQQASTENGASNGSPTTMTKRKASKNRGDSAVVIAGVTITNPDRVLYPQQGLTKQDLAAYYESVSDFVLPHVVGRPLTIVRCPSGQGGECFYQKHVTESVPEAIRGVMVKMKGGREKYVAVDDLAGIVSLVQMGVLEIHPWGATAKDLEKPDRIVFDLDPGPGVKWKQVVAAAREVRDLLGEHKLVSFVRLSGGKGLHVVVPIEPRRPWDEVKQFAKDIAVDMAQASPTKYIATATKAKRGGKIFVDYLRNGRGATAVASYSSRARTGAPVAMPLRWEELGRTKSGEQYNVVNTTRRLGSQKVDPWKDFFKIKQSL
jgi:bifunctional non-homologous end joining protein LigD